MKLVNNRGLTLLEILLAIGLMMIVATTLVPIFVGYLRRSELEDHSKQLLSVLQRAQRFSQTYEGSDTWVVELRNTTSSDYFLVYPSNTPSQLETFYLPSHVVFTDATVPAHSPTSSLYITFEKFTGKGSYATTTPPIFENSTKTIDLILVNKPESPVTIEVTSEGKIARMPPSI